MKAMIFLVLFSVNIDGTEPQVTTVQMPDPLTCSQKGQAAAKMVNATGLRDAIYNCIAYAAKPGEKI